MKFVVARCPGLRSPCSVVKAFRSSSVSRCFVVAVMLLSWLVITNHCALGRMQVATGEHTHCHPAKSDDGKKSPGDGMRECCRAVKASLASQVEFKFDVGQFQFHSVAFLMTFVPVLQRAPEILLDHGPPRAVSFAEIVLQQSLLSHAPPIVA